MPKKVKRRPVRKQSISERFDLEEGMRWKNSLPLGSWDNRCDWIPLIPIVQPLTDEERRHPVIEVDRTIPASYPKGLSPLPWGGWFKTGPRRYDVRKAEHFFLREQHFGGVKGERIYDFFVNVDRKKFERCADLRDLEEIQRRGIDFFRLYFGAEAVFAWRSVCGASGDPRSYIHYLIEEGGEVVRKSRQVTEMWGARDIALVLPRRK